MKWLGSPVVLGGILTLGCGAGEPSTVVRTDSAGVEIVHSRGVLPDLWWTADTLAVFGGEAEGSSSFYRVRRALVDTDRSGTVYVLDPSLFRVTAFTPEGTPLRSWGRRGEGPGELEAPLSVSVHPDGTVVVHEAARGVLVRYSTTDEVIDEQSAPPVMQIAFRHFESTSAGTLFWVREPYRGSDERTVSLMLRGEHGERPLIEGRDSYSSTAYWPRCDMRFTMTMPLSPRIHWSESADRVGVAAWPDLRVDLYSGARLVRRLLAGEPTEPVSEAEAAALLERRGVRGPCNSTASEFVERHGTYERPQVVRSLTLSPDGAVWVEFILDDQERVMVFDSSGVALGTLPAGFPMPLTFLSDGRGLIPVVDSLDVERLGVLEVRSEGTVRE